MTKWEQDLGKTFEMDEWSKMVRCASGSYINTSLIEANYKVLMRWYMVPTRIAECFPGVSPVCFRGCGMEGQYYTHGGLTPR